MDSEGAHDTTGVAGGPFQACQPHLSCTYVVRVASATNMQSLPNTEQQ